MKRLKFPYLLCVLVALLLFPFFQPDQASGEGSANFNDTVTASVSTVESDDGLLEPISDWFGSLGDNIEVALDGLKDTFDKIVSYIGELFESVEESIAVFTGGGDSNEEITNLNNTIDRAKENLGDISLELDETTVYRVIREDEEPGKGIFAKAPEREHITIAGHVNNGSKKNFKGSKYISTTKSFEVALENATKDIMNAGKAQDLRIVQIDLGKVTNTYYDLTDPKVQDKYLVNSKGEPWEKVRRYANKSQELLVEYSIPQEAITLLGRPSEFGS
ncbi:DUF7587 domain-containing protein [Oceanobacillus chungangensis]|uniref:DUF7587 domain-containing protein n=1 Tax=Oceanobacillus chungangensis TaxID=1229152 RepID=A0A3D8PG08_9BACI|nr:hypothetical protein [Oceanobacillus chungangensis]RDW15013.1 hypothetical protein CWR45_19375 [Oceanobacillus chungangensis]